jgi:excinuclease UvrABC nuclease subunit
MSSISDKKLNVLARKSLPDKPGVYFFLGEDGGILYIGKATSLRDRVRSYFAQDLLVTRGPKLQLMIERARSIKWKTTDSALEALLLESYLIKKHQPPYNTDEKDDKSYNYVVVTKEKFPRVLLMRGKDLESLVPVSVRGSRRSGTRGASAGFDRSAREDIRIRYAFGPFPQGGSLYEAMKIVRRIFPFRDRCVPSGHVGAPADGKPCFNHQIGLCPGVCVGKVDEKEYAGTIRNIRLFFEGKKGRLVKQLEKEMKEAAKRLEFERANGIKKTLFALGHIQDVALLKNDWRGHVASLDCGEGPEALSLEGVSGKGPFRIEAYDAAHLAGKDAVGVMTVVEDGVPAKSEYRQFKLRAGSADDLANLEEILTRRLAHREWRLPSLVVVDGDDRQIRVAAKVLAGLGLAVPVVSVVKDERHRAREILGSKESSSRHRDAILLANVEAHRFAVTFHRKRRGKSFLEGKMA